MLISYAPALKGTPSNLEGESLKHTIKLLPKLGEGDRISGGGV